MPNFSADIDQFVPMLATSWTQNSPKQWTVKLRQGVKSQYGNELTSADVVYTFARAKSVSGSASNSWFLANVGGIIGFGPVLPKAPASAKVLTNEVVAVDKYTVQFNLFEESGRLFMVALADTNLTIFDSVAMKKHATASDPWSHTWGNQNCAGFGPYEITTYKPGTQIIYQYRKDYYRPAPKYTKIFTSAVAEAGSRVAALKTGQAQIAEYLDPADLASLQGDSSVSLVGSYTNDIAFICLNYSYAPWNLPTNKLIRQAIAYAIPYDDIVNLDYLGFARRMYSQVPSTFDGYVANMTYQTNLDKAKALLSQAGFPGGAGLNKYSSGLQFYFVSERSSLLEPVANRIKTNLASIGINITLQPLPQSEFATRQLQTGNMPMSLFDFSSPSVPSASFLTKLLYQNPVVGRPGRPDALLEQGLRHAVHPGAIRLGCPVHVARHADAEHPHDRPADDPAGRGAPGARHDQAADRLVPGPGCHGARVLLRHQLGGPHGHRAVPSGRARGGDGRRGHPVRARGDVAHRARRPVRAHAGRPHDADDSRPPARADDRRAGHGQPGR